MTYKFEEHGSRWYHLITTLIFKQVLQDDTGSNCMIIFSCRDLKENDTCMMWTRIPSAENDWFKYFRFWWTPIEYLQLVICMSDRGSKLYNSRRESRKLSSYFISLNICILNTKQTVWIGSRTLLLIRNCIHELVRSPFPYFVCMKRKKANIYTHIHFPHLVPLTFTILNTFA